MPSTNSKSNSGPLDSIAFSDQRPKYDKRKGIEPNNSLEDKLFSMIKGHFAGGAYEPITTSVAAMFQKFLENGQYDDIFHEPSEETAHRGMCVPEAWLTKAIGKIDDDEGVVKKKFTFAPRKSVSSWSIDELVAEEFSEYDVENNSLAEKNYNIIMKARVSDNKNKFIDCNRGLYDLEDPDTLEDFMKYNIESETIALGPIKVYELQYKLAHDPTHGATVPKSTKKKSSKKKTSPLKSKK